MQNPNHRIVSSTLSPTSSTDNLVKETGRPGGLVVNLAHNQRSYHGQISLRSVYSQVTQAFEGANHSMVTHISTRIDEVRNGSSRLAEKTQGAYRSGQGGKEPIT